MPPLSQALAPDGAALSLAARNGTYHAQGEEMPETKKDRINNVLLEIQQGCSVATAMSAGGFSREEWESELEADKGLARKVKDAEDEAIRMLEKSAFALAMTGKTSALVVFLLRVRAGYKEEFAMDEQNPAFDITEEQLGAKSAALDDAVSSS